MASESAVTRLFMNLLSPPRHRGTEGKGTCSSLPSRLGALGDRALPGRPGLWSQCANSNSSSLSLVRGGPRLLGSLLCSLAMILSQPATAADASSPAERLLGSPRPLVIGHRGYSAVAPENTALAFQRALQAGVDLVELDYHHTSDGLPFVIHDGTLDRTTDAISRWGGKNVAVAGRTAKELADLEAGLWFQPPVPAQRLLPLAEAVEMIQKGGVTLIERKAGDPATLARLIRERDWLNRHVVQSFDWKFLADLHQLEPRQVLGALGPLGSREGRKLTDAEKALNPAWITDVLATGARIVVWNRQVDAAAVRVAHERGLRVWVYTIDEPEVAAELLKAGVDGIITNNAAVIWRAVALNGSSHP
jgi:glycerophosphoryl diester phosphodiesterase